MQSDTLLDLDQMPQEKRKQLERLAEGQGKPVEEVIATILAEESRRRLRVASYRTTVVPIGSAKKR